MADASVTVQDLDALIKQIKEKRIEVENQKEVLTNLNKEVMSLEGRAAGFLKELGRDSYSSDHGTLYTVRKWQYKIPEAGEAREAFFDWLKSKGIFEQYATVNANSFTALCNAEREAAAKQGELFAIPGVAPGALFETTQFRRG